MIIGVGIDGIDARRFSGILKRFGVKSYARLLHPNEAQQIIKSNLENAQICLKLAKYWAIKEAVAKSLGTGFRGGLSWRDIELCHDYLGKPQVKLHAHAECIMQQKKVNYLHASLSDEGNWVQALVIAEQLS